MITLTDKAAQHVPHYPTRRGKGVGLRVDVKTTGCSGLAYKFEYIGGIATGGQVFESNGAKMIVGPKSLPYIDDTELDYVHEELNKGFRFNSPNVKNERGYDESFRV